MPKIKNKLLYYAHRKYGKDIIVRKEEDGLLRFWTEFQAVTLTFASDGKIEEKIRKREGANAKQHFSALEQKPKTEKAGKPVKARKKAVAKKPTAKKPTVKNTITKAAREKNSLKKNSPKKQSEKAAKVTTNTKPIKKVSDQEPKHEKVVTPKTTKKSIKVARPKFRPGDFVKSIYCDDVFTIISNDGDGMVRVAAGHVALNDTKFHSEYIMAQSDLV